jgi:hypothetical protein
MRWQAKELRITKCNLWIKGFGMAAQGNIWAQLGHFGRAVAYQEGLPRTGLAQGKNRVVRSVITFCQILYWKVLNLLNAGKYSPGLHFCVFACNIVFRVETFSCFASSGRVVIFY